MANSLTVAAQPEQEKAESVALGVYVHIPFCSTTCEYCAFYQVRPEGDDLARFLRDIERELALVEAPLRAQTVFWGGGTPGLLPAKHLGELCGLLRGRLATAPMEWSVEMAPGTVTRERLAALRDGGVTRISLGVQSLQPELLAALGRRHSREQALRAYDLVREAGFASVNLDLIFAIPGQEAASWRCDLAAAVALGPDHISTYCLTFEEDTALFVKLSQGKVTLDVEKEAAFYETTWDELGAAGFAQYEISNYARPGHACRHNLNTWAMQEWLGFGPSGASQHAGWRYQNPPDLAAWRVDLDRGRRGTADRTALTPELLAADTLIFGLRCNAGVNLAAAQRRFPMASWNAYRALAARLVAEDVAEWGAPEVLRLTRRGRLLADSVGAAVMEI
ncbi:MAG: radical SAM family heme chaperone HemW [Opitutaceae bacterium]